MYQQQMSRERTDRVPSILQGHVDERWQNKTVYNFYNTPEQFMRDIIKEQANSAKPDDSKPLCEDGQKAYKKINEINPSEDKMYEDIAKKVRNKLHARGFTSKLLYGDVGFTTEKSGAMSIQRALMGKPDCYFKNTGVSDGKLFHDLYINLSYSWGESDKKIKRNSYALYALVQEMAKLISMRVIVVNHTGSGDGGGLCYSYIVKQFRQKINPQQFCFFTSESKRTFGWSYYSTQEKDHLSTVGKPTDTVSIADFSLDRTIEDLWKYYKKTNGKMAK